MKTGSSGYSCTTYTLAGDLRSQRPASHTRRSYNPGGTSGGNVNVYSRS